MKWEPSQKCRHYFHVDVTDQVDGFTSDFMEPGFKPPAKRLKFYIAGMELALIAEDENVMDEVFVLPQIKYCPFCGEKLDTEDNPDDRQSI